LGEGDGEYSRVATSSQPPVAVRKSNSPCPSSKEVGVEVVTIIFITSVMGKPNPPYFFFYIASVKEEKEETKLQYKNNLT
jgi:hypothetical protein